MENIFQFITCRYKALDVVGHKSLHVVGLDGSPKHR
jgi:hypothetical protein